MRREGPVRRMLSKLSCAGIDGGLMLRRRRRVQATAQHTAAAFAGQAGVFGGGLLSLCQKVLVRPIWDDDEGSMS